MIDKHRVNSVSRGSPDRDLNVDHNIHFRIVTIIFLRFCLLMWSLLFIFLLTLLIRSNLKSTLTSRSTIEGEPGTASSRCCSTSSWTLKWCHCASVER